MFPSSPSLHQNQECFIQEGGGGHFLYRPFGNVFAISTLGAWHRIHQKSSQMVKNRQISHRFIQIAANISHSDHDSTIKTHPRRGRPKMDPLWLSVVFTFHMFPTITVIRNNVKMTFAWNKMFSIIIFPGLVQFKKRWISSLTNTVPFFCVCLCWEGGFIRVAETANRK